MLHKILCNSFSAEIAFSVQQYLHVAGPKNIMTARNPFNLDTICDTQTSCFCNVCLKAQKMHG